MLRREPIVSWTILHHAFVYGRLFLLLEVGLVSDRSFVPTRLQVALFHVSSTGWLGIHCTWMGNLLGSIFSNKPQYEARQHAILVQSGGKRGISPEGRLPGVSLSLLFTLVGMFWFALSARPDVHWLVPVLSGVPVGLGMTLLQLSLLNYYIDLYPSQSASVVLAANCAARNVVSTIFPSLGIPLYITRIAKS